MRETAKRLLVLSGVAAAIMAASAMPALAQEEGALAAGAAQYGAEPEAREEVTATFELAVEGEVSEGASFFGYLDNGEPFPVALADPDGDGVYVGSYDHIESGDSLEATIVQGTGSREDLAVGASPGEPTSTIRDFGVVTFDGDQTLSAAVSFADEEDEPAADPAGSSTPVEDEASPAPVFVGVGGEDATNLADKKIDEVAETTEAPDGERALPNTGGALGAMGAGALLTAAGLLARRMTR